jgi:hypothetical protein
MAAPNYSSDLTDVDDADTSTNWSEINDGAWDDGDTLNNDTDYPYIQGNASLNQEMNKTGVCSAIANNGSAITLPTDGAFLVWILFTSPVIDSYANGGIRVVVMESTSLGYSWDVGGNDYGREPYGGWACYAVNPTEPSDDTIGTPVTGNYQYIGAAVKTTAGISKGHPFCVDAVRWGRCEFRVYAGDVTPNGPATFAGMAAYNDVDTRRWGLFQEIAGGFLWKGKMTIGYNSNACYFVDSNINILIDDVPKCTSAFNLISIETSGTDVQWTNVIFTALGTQSRGTLVAVNGVDLIFQSCQFVGMLDFTFIAHLPVSGDTCQVLDCIFRGCEQISAPGTDMTGTRIIEPTVDGSSSDKAALIWNVGLDPDGLLDDMVHEMGSNNHHAIEFGTLSPLTMSLNGNTFTGFGADNTFASALYFARTSGTITLSVDGATPTYKSAGATVNIVGPSISVTVTCRTQLGGNIQNARVLVKASDGTGPFPFEETVTIVNSGTTATVTHTGHGMASNDKVLIDGASHWQNNGVFQITVTGVNTYTYTLPSAPGSSPTGTIKSTYVALEGLTDVNGEITMSRNFPTDQPVDGWARKSSAAPYYKSSPIGGTIETAADFAATVVMISDE